MKTDIWSSLPHSLAFNVRLYNDINVLFERQAFVRGKKHAVVSGRLRYTTGSVFGKCLFRKFTGFQYKPDLRPFHILVCSKIYARGSSGFVLPDLCNCATAD